MPRLDLDDLPPKLAAILTGAAEGEEILLVKDSLVVGRLVAGEAAAPPAEPPPPPEEDIKQVFEDFRSAIEEEF